MYPAFVNCTTIDWFSEWPLDALLEVADKYLSEDSLGSEEEVGYLVFMVAVILWCLTDRSMQIVQTCPEVIIFFMLNSTDWF